MQDPINFTSKDSMYEAAAAILRGETPEEVINEGYVIKYPHIKKLSNQLNDFDDEEIEDLLFMLEDHFRNMHDYSNTAVFEKVANKLKMAAYTWKTLTVNTDF